MALTYKSSLPLQGIAVPLFAVFLAVGFELALQLSALISLSLSLGVSLVLPTIEVGIAVAINLILQFNLALGFSLPSFTLNLSLALSFELSIVLSFVAALEALINAIVGVNICAYGWLGPATDLGANLDATIGGGWPDGTSSSTPVDCYLFVATARGPYTPDQVADLSLVVPPPPPPTPTSPPPPFGAYPPPQSYETGLAGVSITAPPMGGAQATGSITVDNSVRTGVGKVTGVSITSLGAGYTSAPTVTITDAVAIVSATTATPIVVTLPNALTIPTGQGLGVTISGVTGSITILDAVPGVTDKPALLAAAQAAEAAATTPNTSGALAAATAAAGAAGPITVTVASTAGITTLAIPPGSYGLQGLNGTWYLQATSGTTGKLWADAAFMQPSQGSGTYTPSSAVAAANICGLQHGKVVTPTTIALYSDAAFTLPVSGVGTYSGGTVTGGGSGAAATCTMGGGSVNALQSFLSGIPWPQTEGLAGGVLDFSAMLGGLFDLFAGTPNGLYANLQARAKLLGGASASVGFTPPTIAASLQLLGKISANLAANINVKLPSLSVEAGAALSANISALASLSAGISFFLGMSKAGLELEIWEYTGPGSGFGAAVAAGPGASGWHDGTPASTPVVAGVFGLTTVASAGAFSTFFAGA